ncbi:MAG: Gfo/Idh/MocA family oxidoreductase [Thermoflexales bacterium]|nr:Gfo/Idh/MocA family oxidoreductase [Thermoflexales bacterium]
MTRKLNIAVIGTGGIVNAHMPGWIDAPHAQVVTGYDQVPAAAQAWAAKYGIPKVAGSVEEILADKSIDAVDICVPNRAHAPIAIAALQAGKHVLCEKPLAPTPEEVRQMIAARDASGRMLMTAQHFRFGGSARALKAEIDRGALGNVYHARSWMLRRNFLPTRPGFIQHALSGGGVTIDIGVHILDLTLWMMGHPRPVSVSGSTRTVLARQPGAFSSWNTRSDIPREMDVEEMATAFVRFENGATLILEVSWMLHHAMPNGKIEDMQMWLYGDRAGARWPTCELISANNATSQFYSTTLGLLDAPNAPHKQECLDFAKAIIDGAPSPVPAEHSLQVIAILDAVYRSQKEGREIRLDG